MMQHTDKMSENEKEVWEDSSMGLSSPLARKHWKKLLSLWLLFISTDEEVDYMKR